MINTRVEPGRHMGAQCHVNLGVLQDTCFDHALRAAEHFFPGLEHELHRAVQLFPQLRQDHSRPQQPCGVGVVPAGVHLSRCQGRAGKARGLRHRQGVHIRPQQNGPTRKSAPDGADHAGAADVLLCLDSQLPQAGGDRSGRPHLFKPQLRVAVQVRPDLPEPGRTLAGQPQHCFFRYHTVLHFF